MSLQLQWAQRLKKAGAILGRDGLSKRAAAIMVDLVTKSGSYKEAMIAAGRLKAVAAAAKYDGYWTEKVDEGYHKEMAMLEWMAKGAAPPLIHTNRPRRWALLRTPLRAILQRILPGPMLSRALTRIDAR
jgi:hypothetical protein